RHIGEDDDVTTRLANRRELRVLLAKALLRPYQFHPLPGVLANDVIGGIVRAIGGDDDFQLVPVEVECQGIAKLVANARLLVVGRYDERQAEVPCRCSNRPDGGGAAAGQQLQYQWVNEVAV